MTDCIWSMAGFFEELLKDFFYALLVLLYSLFNYIKMQK